MRMGSSVGVIVPIRDETQSPDTVISAIPQWIDEVIVCDSGSTERSPRMTIECNGRVVRELRCRYGSTYAEAVKVLNCPDIVVFLSADSIPSPDEVKHLVDPIVSDEADMLLAKTEPGMRSPHVFSDHGLCRRLIAFIRDMAFTDPVLFQAVRFTALQRLTIRGPDHLWRVQILIKAMKNGLRIRDVPVSSMRKIRTKRSRTPRGLSSWCVKILGALLRAARDGLSGDGNVRTEENLVILARYPVPGKTKTRLIPALGAQGAADLHRKMAEFTVYKMRDLAGRNSLTVKIFLDGSNIERMRQWLGTAYAYYHQADGDLGRRMLNAFRRAFREGSERTVIVGTDCPGLDGELVDTAFNELHQHDLVIGPASDGGYYLIGARRPHPALFAHIPWGTGEVLKATLRVAIDSGLSVKLLKQLDDIDRPEDVHLWDEAMTAATASGRETPPSVPACPVSVIVPALNEDEHISATISAVQTARVAEIIVVDGGSSDRTVELALGCGVKVLRSQKGRSTQMNAGARHAAGDILLFLHADTLLPMNWCEHVVSTLDVPGVSAGAFLLRLDGNLRSLRIIERLANIRSNLLQMPYGDQAIFLRKEMFRRIGGFPDIPVMEDFELVKKLRKQGKINLLSLSAVTSSRRWSQLGIWKTTAINQIMVLGNLIGLPLDRLARLYQKETL